MKSGKEGPLEKMPDAGVLARCALPAIRDVLAGSPPWRAPARTSSSRTPAGGVVLLTLRGTFRVGQPAPQGLCRCGARSEWYHEAGCQVLPNVSAVLRYEPNLPGKRLFTRRRANSHKPRKGTRPHHQ